MDRTAIGRYTVEQALENLNNIVGVMDVLTREIRQIHDILNDEITSRPQHKTVNVEGDKQQRRDHISRSDIQLSEEDVVGRTRTD